MPSNFPNQIDVLPSNLQGNWDLNTPGYEHSVQHNNLVNAIIAAQTKLGVDSSIDVNSIDYKLANTIVASISQGSLVAGQALQYNGTAWTNTAISLDGGLV